MPGSRKCILMSHTHLRRHTHRTVAVTAALASLVFSEAAPAQTKKGFINYIKPTQVTCSPLSSASWGVTGVLPRDLCNGIESHRGAGVSPEYYYWDGQIIKATDGKFHLFMSTWSGSAGFNPGWTGSDAFHAISSQGVLGPYEQKDYIYTNNGSHKGHNVSALELLDGTYAVVVSETVPFTVYQSSSLDGPWKGCQAAIQANGINYGSDGNFASNVSLIPRHDGKFEIVQRHGLIGVADSICGPYKLQKPTWTYAAANRPTIDSIYPKRTSIPGVSNPSYAWEEDPHIWRSGGVYHVLYSGSGDRVGWHLYSTDGITNWTDDGLAFSPREYQKIFCYEGGTCNQWYKMERPGVVLQGGHPTHITWAVADVDKDNQIPANSNHGSKVIVVPFDGTAFDSDYGTGSGGSSGGTGTGGTSSGTSNTGGTSSTASGGRSSNGGASNGGASNGGSKATGGAPSGGTSPMGGFAATSGGAVANLGGASATTSKSSVGGTTAAFTTTSTGGGTTSISMTTAMGVGGSSTSGGSAVSPSASGPGGIGNSSNGAIIGGQASAASEAGTGDERGCGCRVAGPSPTRAASLLVGMLCSSLLVRLRRRASRRRHVAASDMT